MKTINLNDMKIDEIIATMGFPVRKNLTFSFGDMNQCEDLLLEIFDKVDMTVNRIQFIPEYKEITDWMSDTKGKGLALFGSVGRGKTVINSFILPILFYERYGKLLTPQIAEGLTRDSLNKWAYCIDDIGTESIVNEFGTKTDMVSYAINNAEHFIKPLFLTSNLTRDELVQRYGIRTYDRIKRLCKIVIFTGKSLRQ